MPGANSIDGISSGFNTTEIVDAIIKFERRNAVLLEQEQTEKTNIVSAFKALQAKVLALSAQLAQLAKASTFNAAGLTVSDESALRARTTGRVASGSYDIQVLSLARNHQLASQGFSDESMALFGTGTISIQVGSGSSRTLTIDSSNNSLIGIKQAINDAQVGVRASIINDGSSSDPFRLLLIADKTGVANGIEVTSELTGGQNLDFLNATFDSPEIVSFDSGSEATVSLGASAAYTGAENKVYTFTVLGSGSQTVGTDSIEIQWSDGLNSGTITVDQADTDVVLTGDGADGLAVSISAGSLHAGDIFQVSTFAPVIQDASDARISFGASGGSGSPLIVTSSTNTFANVIGGVSFDVLRATGSGETVTLAADVDVSGIRTAVNEFIKRYNEVVAYIDDQNTYNQDSGESGVLFGDSTLWLMRHSLSTVISDRIAGLAEGFSQLHAIGIRTRADGTLAITNPSAFEEALRDNLEDVTRLFTEAGTSSHAAIEYVSATSATVAGENYEVDITTAATRGRLVGTLLDDLAGSPITITEANNTLKLKVNGRESEAIRLTSRTYDTTEELVAEIQTRIDSDAQIGDRGLEVTWVDEGEGGHLEFTNSAYGRMSKVERITSVTNSAYGVLGLSSAVSHDGTDVAGTINGEEAEGTGLLLKGKEGNATTEGLVLRVSLDESQVVAGAEGTVSVTKGVAARLLDKVDSFSKSGEGALDRRIKSVELQIDTIGQRIEEIDERLAARRESLFKRFYEMELALGEMNATGQFLTTQLANLNNNWAVRGNRNSGSGLFS